ncbi:hypothetical protein IEQ34_013180 [Dendrobium chrysotoxum]|uniref:Exocyst subunit Exo70 family protein n=1 Tax=Dendrobium chrysotoxum TaxID=161865 RepID=A0AAV7GQV3_DENCH|nr:hypothetical protein IEQ34_013180 [Dendrobium chrysotoxum]
MHEIMHELLFEIERIFEGKTCSKTRNAAHNLSRRLAQTSQETFGHLKEAVEEDATKTGVMDGTEFEKVGEDSTSQLGTITMRIMQALQSNMDGKSKQYKDPALAYLFIMNNIHYMVRSVPRSKAKD